jgi:DNA-binding transcriptional regulator YiaG
MTKHKRDRQMADDIMAGVAEIEAMIRDGAAPAERFTVRTVSIPGPGKHTPKALNKLRASLGMSQPIFAELIGVSAVLVQSWERGVREPSLLARRLLDTITRDPAGWVAALGGKRGTRRAG